MRTTARILFILLAAASPSFAQVPQMISYQGRVTVGGTNFNSAGQFKFALVNNGATQTYWSNGVNPVSLSVTKGLYSVLLGDTGIANMSYAIPSSVFTNSDVRLRVWFGGQLLSPDQRLAAVGYSLMSANVPDGAITSNKLASGAVTAAKIATGAVGSAQLATGAVLAANIASNAITAGQIAAGAITSVNIASNTITAGNLAPGIGIVPSGTLVLSVTASNGALLSGGYVPQMTELGVSWVQVTNAAPWASRYHFGAVTNNGQLWVLGGETAGFSSLHDVWSSSDGATWTQVTGAAAWSARDTFAAVTFSNQMWVLGGTAGSSYLNDVWSSSNGISWTQVTNAAPWAGRCAFGAVVFNSQIWVLGGMAGIAGGLLNDVWSSSNGVTWTQATSAAPWTNRYGHAVLACNGQMWVMGGITNYSGGFLHDVWSSSNGVTWTQVTNAAPWSARYYPGAVAVSGRMWILGGVGAGVPGTYYNDVWSSADGLAWVRVTNAAPWSARDGHSVTTFNGQMWLLGGYSTGLMRDVWSSPFTFTNMLGSYYLYRKQ